MSLVISEDIKTVSELKKRTREVLQQVKETGRPTIITVKGKPDVVLIEVKAYERMQRVANLGLLLAEAEADYQKGRFRDFDEFVDDLRKKEKV